MNTMPIQASLLDYARALTKDIRAQAIFAAACSSAVMFGIFVVFGA